jgi:hypothetical protein
VFAVWFAGQRPGSEFGEFGRGAGAVCVAVEASVDKSRKQLRGGVDGRVDAEGGTLVGGAGKQVYEGVTLVIP